MFEGEVMLSEKRLGLYLLVITIITIGILYIINKPSWSVYPLIGFPLIFYFALVLPEYKKITTPDQFFLLDRRMRSPQFRHTYVVTNVGLASSLIFSAYIGFYFGISAMFWGPLTWAIGIGFYYLIFPKIVPHLKSDHTLHEFLANRYSRTDKQNEKLRFLTSITTSIIFFALMSVEIYMASIILKPIMGNAPAIAIAVIVALVAFTYSYIAGYSGVVKTDKYQLYLMIFASIVMLLVVVALLFFQKPDVSVPSELKYIFSMNWKMVIAIFLVSLPYQLCMMDMWQRTFAMGKCYKSDNDLIVNIRKQLLISTIIYTFFFWIFMSVGICVRSIFGSEVDPNLILNKFFELTGEFGSIGHLFFGLILMGIIAAIISTVDSYLNSMTQTFMYDIYSTKINKKLYKSFPTFSQIEKKRFVNISRFFIPIFGICGIILVFFVFEIFNFLMNIYTLAIILFPATLYAVFKEKRRLNFKSAYISILVGIFIVVLLSFIGTFASWVEEISFSIPLIGKILITREDIPLYAPIIGIALSFILIWIKFKSKES